MTLAPTLRRLRIQPRLLPALAASRELDPVVKPEGPVLPELERDRNNAEAGPVGRARHLADRVLRGIEGYRLFEGEAALERARLLARPGADAAIARTTREIGVSLVVADPGHRPACSDLPPKAFPVEEKRCLRVGVQLATLRRVDIGVEDETAVVRPLQEHHAQIGQTILVDRGEPHRGRVV